ncbi:endonuclease/exonuclease/phosphatase family protein [Microvirga sp. 2YAF29]|uniref:endonuclease/exonuclease/phosphatase family protein n=1 Tax=Microvirga sp. 2YAF29 TaxID=3233031 RepID=UPI003F98C97E
MPRVASRIVERLPCPPEALLEEARKSPKDPASHAAFFDRIAAFGMVEMESSPEQRSSTGALRLASFNAERLTVPDAVSSLLMREGIDVALLCEADSGMARSGNIHTIRALSAALGMGYAFGAEFVELDLGDAGEMRRHQGRRNACSLHGNAIVSRFRIEEAHLIRLETGGLWFGGIDGAQHRVGGRIALAARIAAPHPLWVVSTHLESKTDSLDRQRQVRTLLQVLKELAGDAACIIGGDFNTKDLPRGEGDRQRATDMPEVSEPLFNDLREAGFGWQGSNTAQATQRNGPWKTHEQPFGKLDWIFVRGVKVTNPTTVSAVDENGKALSDHDMPKVDVSL